MVNIIFRDAFEKIAGISHKTLSKAVLNRLKISPDSTIGQKILARIPGYSRVNGELVGALSKNLSKAQQNADKKGIVKHFQKYRKG